MTANPWTMLGLSFVVLMVLVPLAAGLFLYRHWAPDRSVESLAARWAQPPSQFVAMDGMRVHLRDEGPRDDPAPIVLLHGTGSSLHTWDGWAARLSSTRRVIRFDRPGFGLTGPDPHNRYGMAHSATLVLRLLDTLGVQRFVIAGNSSGGRIAWHVALAAPQRVERLVLVAAAGYPRRTPLPFGLRMAQSPLGAMLSNVLPHSMVERGVRGMYGDPRKVDAALVDRNYEIALRQGNRKALGETLRQGESADAADIRRIKTPTLILWGERDSVIPLQDATEFFEDIVGSRVVTFGELGHLPHEEDPAATVAAVMQWLQD